VRDGASILDDKFLQRLVQWMGENLITMELASRSELRVLLLICEEHKYVEETTSLGFVHWRCSSLWLARTAQIGVEVMKSQFRY